MASKYMATGSNWAPYNLAYHGQDICQFSIKIHGAYPGAPLHSPQEVEQAGGTVSAADQSTVLKELVQTATLERVDDEAMTSRLAGHL